MKTIYEVDSRSYEEYADSEIAWQDFKEDLLQFIEEYKKVNPEVKKFRMECLTAGWNNTHGYTKDLWLDSEKDILQAFTRDYDYRIIIKLYPHGKTEIRLSSHDSPMGEILYMIPIDMDKTEKVVAAIRSDEDLYHTIYCINTLDWNFDRQQLSEQGIGYIDSVNILDQDISFDYMDEMLHNVQYYNFDDSVRS